MAGNMVANHELHAMEMVTQPVAHFSAHSNAVNLFVIVTRERKAVQSENKFSEANKGFSATVISGRLPTWQITCICQFSNKQKKTFNRL